MKLTDPFHVFFLSAPSSIIPRDDESGDSAGSGDESGDSVEDTSESSGSGSGERTFTQADVDNIVVKRNKKVRAQLEKTEAQYENLLKTASLTKQERDSLQTELAEIQTQLRTKDQQAALDAKKREAEFKAQQDAIAAERDHYQNLFLSKTRDDAIRAAAKKGDGFNEDQFIQILGPKTEVVQEKDETTGEKTGRYTTRVRVERAGEDGTLQEVFLTPDQAVEEMRGDTAQFGNLFKSNVANGIGSASNSAYGKGGHIDPKNLTGEQYRENADAIRKQYGIRKPRR